MLTNVVDLHTLGTKLGIPEYKLAEIKIDYSAYGTVRQRHEMINEWLSYDTNPSWTKLASALVEMGNNAEAKKIQESKLERDTTY